MLGLSVVALFSALLVRLWYLSAVDHAADKQVAVQTATRVVQTPAPRGEIVARGGQVLAGDKTVFVATLSRQVAATDPAAIPDAASLLGISQAAIKTALESAQYSYYQPVPLRFGIANALVLRIEENAARYPGLSVALDSERAYPDGQTAVHLLGYVSQITSTELRAFAKDGYQAGDPFGQSGVEAQYQAALAGKPGSTTYAVDAAGQVVGVVRRVAPTPGDTVVLNLDVPLQQQAEKDLAAEIRARRAAGQVAPNGAVVALDPQNGHVLAMASFPSYNPNEWVGGISQANFEKLVSAADGAPLNNYAIQGLYTPGSTFKIATASAALQDGLITPSFVYDDTGRFTVPNCTGPHCTLHNAGYEALGPINIVPAIAASDDDFFYNLGYLFWINRAKYGVDAIQTWANRYGYGEPTGIDLPGESIGFVASPQIDAALHREDPKAFPNGGWYVGDNLEMAFGQGATLISPLQLADAYATFANGGTRYAPQVAAALVSPTGKVVQRFAPKVLGHVQLSPVNRAAMLAGFEGAITEANPAGTAYGTFYQTGPPYPYAQMPIAGKTGTASVQGKQPNSLFVAFGPVSHPRYVIACVISQAGYGASAAAYVVRDLYQWLITHPVGPLQLPNG